MTKKYQGQLIGDGNTATGDYCHGRCCGMHRAEFHGIQQWAMVFFLPTRSGKEVSLALVGTWHSYVHRRTARQVGPIGAGSSFAFDAHQDTGGAPTESNQREKAEWHFSLVS
jgi:hypothetical protein